MERLGHLTLPDYGLHNNDISYFHVNSRMSGRGPNRLRYLDLEGRWKLNGRSIPYISSVFNHLERINSAQCPLRDFTDEPLNAIGMIGWTPSARPVIVDEVEKVEKKPKKVFSFAKPIIDVQEEHVESPREPLPHRSAGYGAAHQKRKLTVPTPRSRTPSVSPTREIDRAGNKIDQHQQKDAPIIPATNKWGSQRDLGYSSTEESMMAGTGNPKTTMTTVVESKTTTVKIDVSEEANASINRPPHRTQALSPGSSPQLYRRRQYEQYTPSYTSRERHHSTGDEPTNRSSNYHPIGYPPYRSGGYGQPHIRRQLEISPRSMESNSDRSGDECDDDYHHLDNINPDQLIMTTYHESKKKTTTTTTTEYPPKRRQVESWIRIR